MGKKALQHCGWNTEHEPHPHPGGPWHCPGGDGLTESPSSRLTALAKALDRLRAEREQLIQPEPLRFALLDFAVAALVALEEPHGLFPTCPECRPRIAELRDYPITGTPELCVRHLALASAETIADALLGKEETG